MIPSSLFLYCTENSKIVKLVFINILDYALYRILNVATFVLYQSSIDLLKCSKLNLDFFMELWQQRPVLPLYMNNQTLQGKPQIPNGNIKTELHHVEKCWANTY